MTNPFQQPCFTQALLDDYSTAIGATTSVDLHVWGFIDGTVGPICRPSHDQRIFYNGHKRTHALKFQAVTAPDGLMTHLFGSVEGRRHDSGVLGESGLLPQLGAHMNGPNGIPYALYDDAAYPLSPYLQKAYQVFAGIPLALGQYYILIEFFALDCNPPLVNTQQISTLVLRFNPPRART